MAIDFISVALYSHYIFASVLLSESGGNLSQLPVLTGGLKPHIFLRSTIRSVTSKLADDSVEETAGNSFPHCKVFKTLLFLRDCNVENTEGLEKTPCKLAGGCLLSKVSRMKKD